MFWQTVIVSAVTASIVSVSVDTHAWWMWWRRRRAAVLLERAQELCSHARVSSPTNPGENYNLEFTVEHRDSISLKCWRCGKRISTSGFDKVSRLLNNTFQRNPAELADHFETRNHEFNRLIRKVNRYKREQLGLASESPSSQ